MKRTARKDTIRNIFKQKVSYISIIVIAAIATMAYLGILFTTDALMNSANEFFGRLNFRDVEVVSTSLLTKEDIEVLKTVEGVADVEPIYFITGYVQSGSIQKTVNVESLTERINLAEIQDGRFPRDDRECVLEDTLAEALQMSIGDTIEVKGSDGNTPQFLKNSEYKIVGIIQHAEHLGNPTYVPGERNVMVLPEAFDMGDQKDCYMKAEIRVDLPEGMKVMDSDYQETVKPVLDRLEEVAKERSSLRDKDLRGSAEEKLAEAEKELAEGKEKLDDAKRQLEEGEKTLAEKEQELADGKKILDDGAIQLLEGEEKLKDAKAKLDEGKPQLDDAKKQLDDAKAQLDAGEKQLKDGEAKLKDAEQQLKDGEQQLKDAEKQITDGEQQLKDGEQQIKDAEKQLEDGEKQLAEGKEKLDAAEVQLTEGRKQLDEAKEKVDSTSSQLSSYYTEIQEIKYTSLLIMRGIVESIMPDEYASQIQWASIPTSFDINSADINVTKFPILKGLTLDLSSSMDKVLETVLRQILEDVDYEEQDLQDLISEAKSTYLYQSLEVEYNSISDSLKQWDDGHEQYLAGREEYLAGEKTYADAKKQYDEGKAEYDSKKKLLDDGKVQYAQARLDYELGKKKLEDGKVQYEEGKKKYEASKVEYEQGKAQYEEAKEKYNAGKKEYDAGKAKYDAAKKEYDDGLRQYEEGLATYEEKKKEYEEGLQKYNDGAAALEEGRKKLEDARKEYEEGLLKYNDGLYQYEEGKKKLESLGLCNWVVMDANFNAGYIHIRGCALNLRTLAFTFSLMFIVVAALVIFATCGRIIEEQRTQVGTQKALGYFTRTVFAKYLTFGMSSTFIGTVIGAALTLFIEFIILYAYGPFYIVKFPMSFDFGVYLILVVLALLLSFISVWFAGYRMIKLPARELMQPPSPKVRKKAKTKSVLPLYSRLIIRNLRTDVRRVVVMIFSVAGCATLLVIGFTLKRAIPTTVGLQYDTITKYDASVSFNTSENLSVKSELKELFDKEGLAYTELYTSTAIYQGTKDMSAATLWIAEPEDIKDYIHFISTETEEDFIPKDSGVILESRLLEAEGLKVGDEITLYNQEMSSAKVVISDYYKNYIGKEVLISPEVYRETFGGVPNSNTFWLKGEIDKEHMQEELAKISGCRGIEITTDKKIKFEKLLGVLDMIVIVLIAAAGLLAYFIILNLINMQLTQHMRELIIMRVNGFTTKETKRYVTMETILTSVMGILMGFGIGATMSYIIITSLEMDNAGFIHTPYFLGWGIAAVITGLFIFVINTMALRRVKNLKLTDIAG